MMISKLKTFLVPLFLFLLAQFPAFSKSNENCGRKLAIIVDPFSSGDELPKFFARKGYEVGVVHAHGPETREPNFFKSYVASGMRAQLVGDWQYSGNIKALAQFLKAEGAKIIVPGSESGVIVGNQLAAAAGLRGNDPRFASTWIDKYEMHMKLKAAGVPYIKQIKTDDPNEAVQWALQQNKWPVVVKPPSSAGTNGVTFAHSEAELRDAFERIFGIQNGMGLKNEQVIVQEFIEGVEFAVDTVGVDGKHIITEFLSYERTLVPGAATLYRANYLMPFEGPIQMKLHRYALRVLEVLEIRNGPAHMEIMIQKNGEPVLVEVGARICGAHTPVFVRAATGYCQVEATVDAFVDPEAFARKPASYDLQKHAVDFFVATKTPGNLFNARILEDLNELPGVIAVYPNFEDGTPLPRSVDSDTLVLHVQIVHEDPDVLRNAREIIEMWEALGYFEREAN